MKKRTALILLATALIFVTACSNMKKESKKTEKAEEISKEKEKDVCKNISWTHKGEKGPENWKDLCSGFSECGSNEQSPINIKTQTVLINDSLLAPNFNYGKTSVDIINNTHTVQFNVDGENSVNLNGKVYKLLQFHYHALSEHEIDGKHFPLEVHFVHKHSDTEFAVIGIMFIEGKENELFNKYLSSFPKNKGVFKSEDKIDLLSLVPQNKSYYYYEGSLTTPPCSEIVSWYVLDNPIEASKEQIDVLSEILHNNYRPVMPINEREVWLYKE